MINRETIDEVKNRIDIVDVISDFVSLKKSGQNYKAMSPFNNEKTASFFVVPAKGIFKDFSSGKGGDAITFVMEHEGMSYMEAIKFLAKKYGVEIQEDVQSDELREQQTEREGLYILMNFAKDYYKETLFNSDEGKAIGLTYFRERGFNDRTIQKFELGYAREGWNNLSDEAISKNYNKELLEKAGLVVKSEEGRTYDRFRGRVIFPVPARSGEREEARDVKLGVIHGHRQAARLEVVVEIHACARRVAEIDVANDVLVGGVDHRDGVLHAVRHEDAIAIRRSDDVPRLGAGGQSSDDARGEIAPRRVSDLNHGNGIARRVGDIGVLSVGRERDALRLVADGDLRKACVVGRVDDGHAVVARVDGEDQPVVERNGNGAGISRAGIDLSGSIRQREDQQPD